MKAWAIRHPVMLSVDLYTIRQSRSLAWVAFFNSRGMPMYDDVNPSTMRIYGGGYRAVRVTVTEAGRPPKSSLNRSSRGTAKTSKRRSPGKGRRR